MTTGTGYDLLSDHLTAFSIGFEVFNIQNFTYVILGERVCV